MSDQHLARNKFRITQITNGKRGNGESSLKANEENEQ